MTYKDWKKEYLNTLHEDDSLTIGMLFMVEHALRAQLEWLLEQMPKETIGSPKPGTYGTLMDKGIQDCRLVILNALNDGE